MNVAAGDAERNASADASRSKRTLGCAAKRTTAASAAIMREPAPPIPARTRTLREINRETDAIGEWESKNRLTSSPMNCMRGEAHIDSSEIY
jgi:hypothetical protein